MESFSLMAFHQKHGGLNSSEKCLVSKSPEKLNNNNNKKKNEIVKNIQIEFK